MQSTGSIERALDGRLRSGIVERGMAGWVRGGGRGGRRRGMFDKRFGGKWCVCRDDKKDMMNT